MFKFTDDWNREIHDHITSLYRLTGLTVQDRNELADELIETYFAVAGKVPPASALERLGSYIMRDDYEDSSPDKVSKQEYPVLSEQQEKRRMRREPTSTDIDLFTTDSRIGSRTGTVTDEKNGDNMPGKFPIHPATVPNAPKYPV